MGADIHSFTEVKKYGKWLEVKEPLFDDYGDRKTTEPFGCRNYSIFSFLANVRNYSHCTPICEPKGLPPDSEHLNTPLDEPQKYIYYGHDNGTAFTRKGEIECNINYHSCSWLTLKELLDFDYEKVFLDRRITRTTIMPNGCIFSNGAALANEGEGRNITYREFLGESFFKVIDVLKSLGSPENVRIVFWFDN